MKIEKAIAILALDNVDDWVGSAADRKAAQQLGIEALKAVQDCRKPYPVYRTKLLPGESNNNEER